MSELGPRAYEIDYEGAFNAFARTLRNDYVSYDRARKIKDQTYLEDFEYKKFNDQGYTIQFVQYLVLYLLALHDPTLKLLVNHTQTPHYEDYTWGMHVRAYGDALYVTDVVEGSAFTRGQRIVAARLFGEPKFATVERLRKRFGASLYGDTAERELWDIPLHFANKFLIERDNVLASDSSDSLSAGQESCVAAAIEAEQLHLRIADRTKVERIVGKHVTTGPAIAPIEINCIDESSIVIIKVKNLQDSSLIEEELENNRDSIEQATGLIIDIRNCEGGAEDAILPLLPYVIAEPMALASYMETTCLTNYTANNVRRQTAALDAFAERIKAQQGLYGSLDSDSGEILELIDEEERRLADHATDGLVEEPCEMSGELTQKIAPRGSASKVTVLTDIHTRDAAEVLTEVARDSGRAVVIGRDSRGSRGYFNPVAITWGPFSLQYAMSRFTDEGLKRHSACVGVAPEVYMPWMPDYINGDPDIDMALSILNA